MGLMSGKFGMVNGQSAVRNWQTTLTSSPKKYVASHSAQGPGRRPGIQDWTGSFGCYGAKPLVMPGETFTFGGFTGPTTGVEATNGDAYGGSAIVESVALTWNWESGDILSHVVNFGGNGAWAKTLAHYEDNGDPELRETIGLGAEVDGETIDNVTTITLTITAENKTYVNSSTAGWTKRVAGTIEATLSLGLQNTNVDDLVIGIGEDCEFKLFVNDEDFWLLRWMHFKDISGLQANREGGDIVALTCNFEMQGLDAANEIGCIVLPGETTAWWGEDPV
jgi:hypothetical protein